MSFFWHLKSFESENVCIIGENISGNNKILAKIRAACAARLFMIF